MAINPLATLTGFGAKKIAAQKANTSKKDKVSGNDKIAVSSSEYADLFIEKRIEYPHLHGVADLFQYPILGYAPSNDVTESMLREKYNEFDWTQRIVFPMLLDETHSFEAEIPQYPVSEKYNLTDNVNILPRKFQGTLVLTSSPLGKPDMNLSQEYDKIIERMMAGASADKKAAQGMLKDISKERRKMRNAKGKGFFENDRAQVRKSSENILYTQNVDNSPYRQYELLKMFFHNKIPMYFINSFELYTNMLIKKLNINRNASNEGRIEVEIMLQQVKFAEIPKVYFIQAPKVKTAKGITTKVQLVESNFCASDPMINISKNINAGDLLKLGESKIQDWSSDFVSDKITDKVQSVQESITTFSLDGLSVDNLPINLQSALFNDYKNQLAVAKNEVTNLTESDFNEFITAKWKELSGLNVSQKSISDKFEDLAGTIKNSVRNYL